MTEANFLTVGGNKRKKSSFALRESLIDPSIKEFFTAKHGRKRREFMIKKRNSTDGKIYTELKNDAIMGLESSRKSVAIEPPVAISDSVMSPPAEKVSPKKQSWFFAMSDDQIEDHLQPPHKS